MSRVLSLSIPIGREAIRGRWLIGTMVVLLLLGELLIRFGGGAATTIVSLLDVALILTPLIGLVVGTMQVHHSREVTELFLAQPVARGPLFTALYLGHSVPMALALAVGIAAPFAWHGIIGPQVLGVAGVAALLAMISSAVAHLIAVRIDDRVRALGMALGVWIVVAVLWDGLVLLIAMQFGHRPIETSMLVMLAINPLDLGRLLILLGTDAAALLGYTGAVLERTLGTAAGRGAVVAALACWTVLPLLAARRAFTRKDF